MEADGRRVEVEAFERLGRYYLEVIGALENENRALRDRVQELEQRTGGLEAAVNRIVEGDLPGEYS